jgi:hypothetical protein
MAGRMIRGMVLACALAGAAGPALADPVTYDALKTMVQGMGYTPKELGKPDSPLFEVTIASNGFDVPLGMEISKSGRYVWVRAMLGQADKLPPERGTELLKKQGEIQPTMFWITKSGNLLAGMAIDNRDVSPEHLRFVMEKIAGDIAATSALWTPPPAQ